MKKETLILVIILFINMAALVYIKPIIAPYYGMKYSWQLCYLFCVYGFPILLLIPTSILVLLFAAYWSRNKDFKHRFFIYIRKSYLVISIILLFINSLLVLSKGMFHNSAFPQIKYQDIKGTEFDSTDLKTGKFKSQFAHIERSVDKQIEISLNKKDTTTYRLQWLSNNEYRLINMGQSRGMNDTLDVRITNNEKDLYDCWVRFGEYAQHQRIYKVK